MQHAFNLGGNIIGYHYSLLRDFSGSEEFEQQLVSASQNVEADEAASQVKIDSQDDIPTDNSNDDSYINDEETKSERPLLSSRFYPAVSNSEILTLVKGKIPETTQKKIRWAENLFEDWRLNRNAYLTNHPTEGEYEIRKQLHDFKDEKPDLCYILVRFFREIKKVNGDDYHTSTIFDILMTLQMSLNNAAPETPIKFLTDPEFRELKDVVDVTMKERSAQGLGRRRQAQILTEDQENILWESGYLGDSNPESLRNALVFVLGVNFALRGGEYRDLRPSNFFRGSDVNGEFLQFRENVSKCFQGGISSRNKHGKVVTAYTNKKYPERCPVKLYDKYLKL